ncbi:odorant receptor 9a [Drosophila busckii]|uniref:odorant receptor 9a n=1 Tax=Drosophila busckii TaxID=30019 RepID=UPI00083F1965|nr:odorant receptor 9a [Drosophila busckii]
MHSNLSNVSIISDALSSFLAVVITALKYGMFVYYRKEFVGLINRIRYMLEQELAAQPAVAGIVEKENRSDQKLSRTYIWCFFSAVAFVAIKPMIIMVGTKLRTGSTTLVLPHSAKYPWNVQLIWLYVPTYAWNILASYGAVAMSLAMDTLFYALSYNLCALFGIAQHRMRHLAAQREAPQLELQAFVEVLQLQKDTLAMVKQLSVNMQPLLFMQFLITALQLCFVGFQLADLFPSPVCLYFIFFVGSLLIALYNYSKCGEHLKQSSAGFADALYDSNWVDFSLSTKRALVVAIMRAQQPSQIKGYVFEANMAVFLAICRSAASYVMVLRRFNVTE